jgi:site-specific DNA-adenine methylase
MRSPIKNLKKKTNSISKIKEIIPKGSIVQAYPFYDGAIEFSLCESDRYVIGATKSPVVHEFWNYAAKDAKRISVIADRLYPSLNENTFDLLRKSWYSYKDPYVRSALFFLLNRCSSLGMITHGELNTENYNPISINDLRTFSVTNFQVTLIPKEQEYTASKDVDINLFNAPDYYFDLLNTEQTIGLEESPFKHTKFLNDFKNKPSIFVYKIHPRLLKVKNYSKILLDQYGRQTADPEQAKEIILHNVR